MARLMHADSGELFRAEVTTFRKEFGDDEVLEYTMYYGPFEDERQAAAAITRAERQASDQLWRMRRYYGHGRGPHGGGLEDIMVQGRVQRTDIRWETP